MAVSTVKKTLKSYDVAYTTSISSPKYVLLSDYATLGIERNAIVGYVNLSGSYPVTLQFATEGIYMLCPTEFSNKSFTFRYFYQ